MKILVSKTSTDFDAAQFVGEELANLKGFLLESAEDVREEAIKDIQTGVKSGRLYTRYNPKRQIIASAPGQSPANDRGDLVRSIVVSAQGSNQFGPRITVGSTSPIGVILHEGGPHVLPRPWLTLAYNKAMEYEQRRRKKWFRK